MAFLRSWRPAPVALALVLLAAVGAGAAHACLGPALRAGPVVPPQPSPVTYQMAPTPASLAEYADRVELRRVGRLLYYDPATGEEVVTHRAATIRAVIDVLLAEEHDMAPDAAGPAEPLTLYMASELDHAVTITHYPESHEVALSSIPRMMDRRPAYQGRYEVQPTLGPALLDVLGVSPPGAPASP